MDAFHQCNDVRRFGAASIELCFLAAGLCELYFEMRLQPWDYAAGMLIVREAGGVCRTLEGEKLRLIAGRPSVVAGGKAAEADRGMYDRLALIDMLRGGRLRERKYAEDKLMEMLG